MSGIRRKKPDRGEFPHRRRVTLSLTIGGDSWKDIQHQLREIDRRIMEGPITSIVSGGYSSNFVAAGAVDESMTGDRYRELLDEWAYGSAEEISTTEDTENTEGRGV